MSEGSRAIVVDDARSAPASLDVLTSRSAPATTVLSDGRTLAYAEYGDPRGIPFFFMHGVPSSRLAGSLIDAAARRSGVRVIAPDRPGYGFSDAQQGRTILDWPRDIAELADRLELARFGVMGISGAVPYVLACAVMLPDRLSHVAILSGLGPLSAPGVMAGMNRQSAGLYRLALHSPRAGRVWMKMLAQTAARAPLMVYRQQLNYLPECDREVFASDAMRAMRLDDFAEAFRQGAAGPGQEAVLHVTDWGFALADVALEVFLWQGTSDRHHPVAMGRYLASALPRARATVVEDVGAFGFVDRMDAIFDALLECPTR